MMYATAEQRKSIENIKAWAEVYYRPLYKTAIIGREMPSSYCIVTRVNHHTATLWLKYRNERVNRTKGFVDLPDKPNWLVMIRNFRRGQDKKMRVIEYLKQRKSRAV